MRARCSRRRSSSRRRPPTPTSSTGRRGPASARSPGRSRRRCSPTGARDPGAVAERVARGTHPDLTWVTPSGAAEMLVADIEEPVVAAATRTPFESARRVFVIEGVDAMNDQAANRMLKTLEEPPPFVAPAAAHRPPRGRAADDRLALSAGALRSAAARRGSRSSSGSDGSTASARGRARVWRWATPRLAATLGERARARRCGRAPRSSCAPRWPARPPGGPGRGCSTSRRGPAWRAGEAEEGACARSSSWCRARSANATNAKGRTPRRRAERRRAHAGARSRAAPGRAVAARRAVHRRGRPGAASTRWTARTSCGQTRRARRRRPRCARASSSCGDTRLRLAAERVRGARAGGAGLPRCEAPLAAPS